MDGGKENRFMIHLGDRNNKRILERLLLQLFRLSHRREYYSQPKHFLL